MTSPAVEHPQDSQLKISYGQKIKIIAITGGIGSGKSTLSQFLRDFGYAVFDADMFARDVLRKKSIQHKIKTIFGSHILQHDGQLNRQEIRFQIQHHPELKSALEDILHPEIYKKLEKKLHALSKIHQNMWVFYESALIIEKKRTSKFDACLLITAPKTFRLEWLNKNRGLELQDIQKTMALQLDDSTKSQHVDFVIENKGSQKELKEKIFEILSFLETKFSS